MITIAMLTFKEMVRRRILLVTIVLAVIFLSIYGVGVHYGYRDMASHSGSMRSGAGKSFWASFSATALLFLFLRPCFMWLCC